MQELRTDIDIVIPEVSANAHRIKRSGLMHAIIEAMDQQTVERRGAQVPQPQVASVPHNRHERRKAKAQVRRRR